MNIKFNIITLFPDMVKNACDFSILKRAQKKKIIEIETINLRDFGTGVRRQVDDTPYGGGPGMVLKVDVLSCAIKAVKKSNRKTRIFLLTPRGDLFNQKMARKLSLEKNLTLVCGHYEGFDERVKSMVDGEISIGDYVLSGGEIAACTIVDAVSRLIPGTLGNIDSVLHESFESDLLEYPQYTKPEKFEGMDVPAVLLSGNHGEISKWRKEISEEITDDKRPDLRQK